MSGEGSQLDVQPKEANGAANEQQAVDVVAPASSSTTTTTTTAATAATPVLAVNNTPLKRSLDEQQGPIESSEGLNKKQKLQDDDDQPPTTTTAPAPPSSSIAQLLDTTTPTRARSISPSIIPTAKPNVNPDVVRSASPAPSSSLLQAIEKVRASKAISSDDETKDEIVKFVSDPEAYAAPAQRDGQQAAAPLLMKREYWFFELHDLPAEQDMVVVLHLLPSKHKYTFRKMSRKEYGTWFSSSINDANPEVPDTEKTKDELLKEIETIRQFAQSKIREAEALKPLIAENERLRAEFEKSNASLRSALASKESAQSDLSYIQAQYSQASTAAVLRANEAQAAEAQVAKLRQQLSTGLKQRDEFQKSEQRALKETISRLEAECELLRQQDKRTYESKVREKASKWDAHVAAIELERQRELETEGGGGGEGQGFDIFDDLDEDEKIRYGLFEVYGSSEEDEDDEESQSQSIADESQDKPSNALSLNGTEPVMVNDAEAVPVTNVPILESVPEATEPRQGDQQQQQPMTTMNAEQPAEIPSTAPSSDATEAPASTIPPPSGPA